jgi:hypothetical protein
MITYYAHGRAWLTAISLLSKNIYNKTHLFDGDADDPGLPLCRQVYDNWGNICAQFDAATAGGICVNCRRRAQQGLGGVVWNGMRRMR